MALPVLILCCLSLLGVADATLLTTGTTVTINNVPYYLPGSVAAVLAAGSIPNGQESVGLVPITVINSSDVTAATAGFSSDDVWQPDFLQGTFPFSPFIAFTIWLAHDMREVHDIVRRGTCS